MQDKRILFRTRECLPALFEGFNDNCVLIHGNFSLRSMLKDARSDQLLAMVGPGLMLWAPREYELFRLMDNALAESLLWQYLQRAPVAESFIWRRWLYVLWDEVAQLVNTGRFNRTNFDLATKSLLPCSPDYPVTALPDGGVSALSGLQFCAERLGLISRVSVAVRQYFCQCSDPFNHCQMRPNVS